MRFDFSISDVDSFAWIADWAWGMPLIVLTVVIHTFALGLMAKRAGHLANRIIDRGRPEAAFVTVVATTTLLATFLHGIEAGIWAIAYYLLGALPDYRNAMLYSLNAMTSYGHENLNLKHHWELLGALEALNGWLLLGLTTGFLFAVIQRIWMLGTRARNPRGAAR